MSLIVKCGQFLFTLFPHCFMSSLGHGSGMEDIVSAPTLSSFRRRLKPFLFQQSYPDIII